MVKNVRWRTNLSVATIALLCMMFQQVLIAILFVGAAVYLGRQVYHSFSSKRRPTGCEKCGTAAPLNKKVKA
jgi:hypothetical protein